MKAKVLRAVCTLLAASLCFLMICDTAVFGKPEDNDAWVLQYENMQEFDRPKYTVPTMFKNDVPFANDRRFPLVVQNNIHYVPVEMFSGLSKIKLHTDYSYAYFYITNDEGKRYISFDSNNNLATTHQYDSYSLETKIFNQTRYLPAAHVAEVLGIKMEIYENIQDGVYALRFSDNKAKLSFADLIKMYSPIKKEDLAQQNKQEEQQTQDPIPELPEMGNRRIYLSVNLSYFGYVSEILSALGRAGFKCTFYVSPENILSYPDKVREIIASGQNIGFLIDSKDPLKSLAEAKENLRLVAKRTTRFVRFTGGSRGVSLDSASYSQFVNSAGICVWDANIAVSDSTDMYDDLYNKLYNLGSQTASVAMIPGKNTASAISSLSSLVRSKNHLKVMPCDETTHPVAFRSK
ncbi:MAG: polysaccharide deacetylase family protein [Clostridia bacterium]|nr:polysaccharide deacetylase family protein [Clostridia bacterium]